MIFQPHTLPVETICEQLGTDLQKGLSEEQVIEFQQQYGLNALQRKTEKSAWRILLEQFLDPVIYVLGAAIILALLFQEYLEAVAVFLVIMITAGIGFIMELQAVRSIESLRGMSKVRSRVLRRGKVEQVVAKQIVPGDILILEEGDLVTADARLFYVDNLMVNESALTGESYQVEKSDEILPSKTQMADQKNMVFKGSLVNRGFAKAMVTATGDDAVIGQVQKQTLDVEKARTPLEKRLAVLSGTFIWFTLAITFVISLFGYLQGRDLILMVKTGIALAVAAIPEGLPIVATIALARGMLRLAHKNVLIKKLEAVQSLGEMGVLCTDKTGTLTENHMEVSQVVWREGSWKEGDPLSSIYNDPILKKITEMGVLCSNVRPGQSEMYGDALELALFRFAQNTGTKPATILSNLPEKMEIPFDSATKMMATIHEQKKGFLICVKGAFEKVAPHCSLIASPEGLLHIDLDEWNQKVDHMASQGLRVLAFAYKEVHEKPKIDHVFNDLVFVGLVGFLDPARQDAAAVVRTYHDAGIQVVMVTGDHQETAKKIAYDVGLFDRKNSQLRTVHGKDLKRVLNEKGPDSLLQTLVFARVTPDQKLDLVKFYQQNNYVVGMTGDGINDVPALKKADVGIAMGIRGTEAAREVADVVLKDDQFASIEMAIRQGRTIFENIRQFTIYLMSSNLAEISAVAFSFLLNLPSPLLPMQILFLNLVTDVFPALALGVGKSEEGIMRLPPRKSNEPIMTKSLWGLTATFGFTMSLSVIGICYFAGSCLGLESDMINNMGFYTLVCVHLVNVFNLPLRNSSLLRNQVVRNPWVWGALLLCIGIMILAYQIPIMNRVLSLVPISWDEFQWVILFGLFALITAQLLKRMLFAKLTYVPMKKI